MSNGREGMLVEIGRLELETFGDKSVFYGDETGELFCESERLTPELREVVSILEDHASKLKDIFLQYRAAFQAVAIREGDIV